MTSATTVHLVRHATVENPTKVLYGRLPGFGLSAEGRALAARLGEYFADVPLTHLRCSPLQRARETMAPIAQRHGQLAVVYDDDLLEAENQFEGSPVGLNKTTLLSWTTYWRLRCPLRPSWGEAYADIAARMRRAVDAAAAAAGEGGSALVISHQLPIWTMRRAAEGRPLAHDPRKRECALGSVTTLTLKDGHIVRVRYAEPVA